jgi:Fic-DOC domain mobile mystery protein B
MGLSNTYFFGQTPLDEDEKEGLKDIAVNTRRELDQLEQLNIEKAIEWTIHRHFNDDQILTEEFIKKLHWRMMGDVWDWAGTFRRSDKNLGVEWTRINIELRKLLDDSKFWIRNKTYCPDEIAIRFKHKLVKIHCFPNGNGRHSRLMADILIEKVFKRELFTWKRSNLVKHDEIRREYIVAIKKADQGDLSPLIQFARG